MTDQELKQYCGAVTVPDREIMDAARRRQAMALLEKIAQERQVILFACN